MVELLAGQFALLTRSGGSSFHGSVFEYLRNDFFDANDWFNDHYGEPITALRRMISGVTLGGPLRCLGPSENPTRASFLYRMKGYV